METIRTIRRAFGSEAAVEPDVEMVVPRHSIPSTATGPLARTGVAPPGPANGTRTSAPRGPVARLFGIGHPTMAEHRQNPPADSSPPFQAMAPNADEIRRFRDTRLKPDEQKLFNETWNAAVHGSENIDVLTDRMTAKISTQLTSAEREFIRFNLETSVVYSKVAHGVPARIAQGESIADLDKALSFTRPWVRTSRDRLQGLERVAITSEHPESAGAAARAGRHLDEAGPRFGLSCPYSVETCNLWKKQGGRAPAGVDRAPPTASRPHPVLDAMQVAARVMLYKPAEIVLGAVRAAGTAAVASFSSEDQLKRDEQDADALIQALSGTPRPKTDWERVQEAHRDDPYWPGNRR